MRTKKPLRPRKKIAKLTAELELAKEQLQKERRKRETKKPVEVSTPQPRRSRTPSATSRKEAAINYSITLI